MAGSKKERQLTSRKGANRNTCALTAAVVIGIVRAKKMMCFSRPDAGVVPVCEGSLQLEAAYGFGGEVELI